jgi:hypothetical protein
VDLPEELLGPELRILFWREGIQEDKVKIGIEIPYGLPGIADDTLE